MKNILASLGMWLTRRFGSVRPGEELSRERKVTDAELRQGITLQPGEFIEISLSPLLVGRDTPHGAAAPTEAKP
jgi:hypothetical protein